MSWLQFWLIAAMIYNAAAVAVKGDDPKLSFFSLLYLAIASVLLIKDLL